MAGHKPFKVLKDRLLADPNVRREYEAQAAEFAAALKAVMDQTAESRAYLAKTDDGVG